MEPVRQYKELKEFTLSEAQFQEISEFIYNLCGIKLAAGKENLVKARLAKRLRFLGMSDFDDYIAYMKNEQEPVELSCMIDEITTNQTSFFREYNHFDFLRDKAIPQLNEHRIRIWSAGCSSGEEPYSIALFLDKHLPQIKQKDIKILATDISLKMLEKAREGVYNDQSLQSVPSQMLMKNFQTVRVKPFRLRQINESIKKMITFARLNLMSDWPMKGPFNMIFCRNVMIYFDKQTREKLVNKYYEILEQGGYLFIGHSESMAGLNQPFKYVQPAVYRKH